jgi:murein DD-endopeptidase MepM/ murein hydrolase activator NlpD
VPGRAVRVLVLPAVVLALAAGPVPATSATEGPTAPATSSTTGSGPDDFETVLEQLREEYSESSEVVVRAAADLRLADAALPRARQTAAHARRLLAQAQQRQRRAAVRRGQAQVRFMTSSQNAEASAAQVAQQQAQIARMARDAYQGGGAMGDMSILLGASSPADLAERILVLRTVASSQRSVLSDLESVQAAIDAQSNDLASVRDDLARADEQAQRELRAVASLETQARAAEEQVGRLVTLRKEALAAAAAAQAEEDAARTHRETVSGQLSASLATQAQRALGTAAVPDGAGVPPRPGTLAWPVIGRLSSPYGMRVHPITGVYKLHTGTDLGAPCGTPIRAARDGVVTASGWNSAYGWRTVISHGAVDGVLLTTTYNHQDHFGIDVGEKVGTGQVIGNVGSTGYSTGCHLHFEVYVNATLTDPEGWLPGS